MATEDDTDSEFDKKLAEEEQKGRARRLDDAPPIGFGQDGKPLVVKPGAPPYQPEVLEDGEDESEGGAGNTDISDLDEIDKAVADA